MLLWEQVCRYWGIQWHGRLESLVTSKAANLYSGMETARWLIILSICYSHQLYNKRLYHPVPFHLLSAFSHLLDGVLLLLNLLFGLTNQVC
jgi:hypothetical protein